MDEQTDKWLGSFDRPGPSGLGSRRSYFKTAPTAERFRVRTMVAAGSLLAIIAMFLAAAYHYADTNYSWVGLGALLVALVGGFWLWGNRPNGIRLRKNTLVVEFAAGGRYIHYDTIESAEIYTPDRRDPPRKRQGLLPVAGWFGVYGTREIPWYRSFVASEGPWVLVRRNNAIPFMIDPADVDEFLSLLEELRAERIRSEETPTP